MIQGFWKNFLILTFYTQQLVKSKQFLFGHSPTGALGCDFIFKSQKDSSFTLDGNKTVLVKFLLGIFFSNSLFLFEMLFSL